MKIFAALKEDIGEGFVWLKKPELPPRCIVKITSPETRRKVFCETLQLDDNFLHHYNRAPRQPIDAPESAIVMSGWYRARLGGLQTKADYGLQVGEANCCWGKLRACMHHPQVVVRVAVWLGIVSVALGVLGLFFGVVSIWPKGCGTG